MGLRGLNCCAVPFYKLHDGNDLIDVFDRIRPFYPNGVPKIKFCVLIWMSGLFPKSNDKTDVFQRDYNYNVLIRIKHASSGNGIDIGRFSFSTKELNENKNFYLNYIIEDLNLELPFGIGDYSVRIFIQKEEDSTWFLQSEQHFLVTNDL